MSAHIGRYMLQHEIKIEVNGKLICIPVWGYPETSIQDLQWIAMAQVVKSVLKVPGLSALCDKKKAAIFIRGKYDTSDTPIRKTKGCFTAASLHTGNNA